MANLIAYVLWEAEAPETIQQWVMWRVRRYCNWVCHFELMEWEHAAQMELHQIIATMRSNLATQLVLCEELEAIADSLPVEIDKQKCLQAARTLYPAIKRAHDFEENSVFPLLSNGSDHNDALASSIERLRYEHWEDESFAEELSDALARKVTDGTPSKLGNAETIGYMLRGFFEGLRRHIAFENDHILPLLVQRLETKS